jgi:hypothetical protein
MDWHWWLAATTAAAVAGLIVIGMRPLMGLCRHARFEDARRDFHRQRERLEMKFIQLGLGENRSPRWVDCEFEDDVAYVRNRVTGELSAFVGVTLEMDATVDLASTSSESGGRYRMGTAVFRFRRRRWETDGRAIFNLTPAEAIRFYHRDLEIVSQEVVENY